MKKLFPITIQAACSLVALAGKPRVKKTTKKLVVTHQKKQTTTKRDTTIIKFDPDSVADAPEGVCLLKNRKHHDTYISYKRIHDFMDSCQQPLRYVR